MLVEPAKAKSATHVEVSRAQLAGLVLGSQSFASLDPALADLDASLDRSHLMSLPEGLGAGLDDAWEQERLIVDGEQ